MPHALPTGTVTFLFTDVEGSTRLLGELGQAGYAEALGRHRDVVRQALDEHEGAEVDTQGDAFFCTFASARSALACAKSVQRALADGPIRLRIGVHTGEALLVDGHYVGMDVHRAARIGACGHGGQVVVSPSTAALLEPGEFELKELGAHRLKDLSAPVTLYQLGGAEFAPLNTLYRTNLPIPATPFLGRENELAELAELASSPDVRLLTLTGPGGTGKTRIGLQIAAEVSERFPDGARWVPLASSSEPELVASTVAQALEVDEEPDVTLTETIAASLRARRMLVLLDNCEHVLEAAAGVVLPVLESCPDVLLLATSREPLAVGGERVYPVQPLLPGDAVSLFDARARAAGARIDAGGGVAVEQLCARLDNLPLAVELAAARAAAIPPAALLERLSSALDVLKGPRDADERQRTLRATIAWSHDLLDPSEQRLFPRLSVFAGGAALDQVEEVCDADLEDLLSLVSKSLVRVTERDAVPRYWMLETIREFAAELLEESLEGAVFRDRHLESFVALAESAAGRLSGPGSGVLLDRLEQELENFRVATRCALERARQEGEDATGRYGASAVALGRVVVPLHVLHGRYAEAEDLIRSLLKLEPGLLDAASLHSQLGRFLRQRGRSDDALAEHVRAALLLAEASERSEQWWQTWIDVKLRTANYHYFEGDLPALRAVIEELRPNVEERGTPSQGLDFLHVLVQDAYRRERYELSEATEELVREIYRRSLELEDETMDFTLGFCLLWRGKLDEAEAALDRGFSSARRRGDALIEARCLVYGAMARRLRGDVGGVQTLLDELERLEDLQGYAGLVAANRAWISLRNDDHEGVVRHAEHAFTDWQSGRRSGPTVFQWTARLPMAAVELARGRADAAFEHARVLLEPSQQPLPEAVQRLLAEAVESGEAAPLAKALELARTTGHA